MFRKRENNKEKISCFCNGNHRFFLPYASNLGATAYIMGGGEGAVNHVVLVSVHEYYHIFSWHGICSYKG